MGEEIAVLIWLDDDGVYRIGNPITDHGPQHSDDHPGRKVKIPFDCYVDAMKRQSAWDHLQNTLKNLHGKQSFYSRLSEKAEST